MPLDPLDQGSDRKRDMVNASVGEHEIFGTKLSHHLKQDTSKSYCSTSYWKRNFCITRSVRRSVDLSETGF